MVDLNVSELYEAGVQFGHRVGKSNPKMKPFISGKKNLIQIISVEETVRGLLKAYHFLKNLTAKGGKILIVGTKRQAKALVRDEAEKVGAFYVSERWLGGTLTNFSTIRSRLNRLIQLENMEITGEINNYAKKIVSSLNREKTKLVRNLAGIRRMERLPDALVILDPKREYIAVNEASKLDIPIIALLDTDCDPDKIDIPIPCNDDSLRSIQTIFDKLIEAILEGKKLAAPPDKDAQRARRPVAAATTPQTEQSEPAAESAEA